MTGTFSVQLARGAMSLGAVLLSAVLLSAVLLSAVLLSAGCQANDPPRIAIEAGPVIIVAEGETYLAPLTMEPPLSTPVQASELRVEADSAVLALFDRLEITGQPGALQLTVQPRCDVVAPGGADTLANVRVNAAESGSASAAVLSIQIRESPSVPCTPRVVAWTGDCSTVPADAGTTVQVPTGATHLCMSVHNQDTINERLWVRTQTDAPTTLIDPASLPSADDVADMAPTTVSLLDSITIRGQFAIDYQVYRGAPDSGATAEPDDRITVNLGDVGTSIEIVTVPSIIAEFDTGLVDFRVWHHDDANASIQTCAKVVYPDPPPGVAARRGRATVRLYEGLDQMAEADTWLCGATFRAAFSPTVDAAATEMIRISASTCDCAAATPIDAVISHDVQLAIASMAESLPCDDAFMVGDAIEVVCADLDDDGDDTPDLVVRTKDTLCVYGGELGRSTKLSTTTVTPAGGAKNLHSFIRSTATGDQPLIIASQRIGVNVEVVQLAMPTVSGQPPTWQPFAPLAGMSNALVHAAPIASTANAGATYLAFPIATPSGRGIRFKCIDETTCCTGPGGCTAADVNIADYGAQESVAGLVTADVNGDGFDEIVFFTFDEITGTKRLHARIIPVAWAGGEPTPGLGPFTRLGGLTVAGARIRGAAIRSQACPVTNCIENVYAAASGGGMGDAVLYVLLGGATPSIAPLQTPGIAYDVAEMEGVLVAGLDFGLYTSPLASPGNGGWRLQDPVLRELTDAGAIGASLPGYGSTVARCHTTDGEGAVAIAVTFGQVRYTKLNIDVVEP